MTAPSVQPLGGVVVDTCWCQHGDGQWCQCTEKKDTEDKIQVGGVQWSGSLFLPQAVLKELSGFLENYMNCFPGLHPQHTLPFSRSRMSLPHHLLISLPWRPSCQHNSQGSVESISSPGDGGVMAEGDMVAWVDSFVGGLLG